MVRPSGDFWLLDFGVARHLDLVSLTPTAAPFGSFTPGYAPPEQFNNRKREIDSRADLFALGVTLVEAATGRNPFRHLAPDPPSILRRVERMPLAPLSLNLKKSAEFRDLVTAMCQTRRDRRPRTVKAALDWIRPICAAEK
jgi:serine/threonine-protein kinase